jgi:hypothetical protein
MGLAMMLLVSGICLYTAYRILQTYTLHSRIVKISEFGDLCGLLLGTGSIKPSSKETVEMCRTGAVLLSSVADPDSLNRDPDSALQVNPDPDPGFC